MAFVYNPDSVKNWSNSLIKIISGEEDSVSSCARKFNELVSELVKPQVWTGAAAYQNYQNFMETHNALVAFSNEFGDAFAQTMNEVARSVAGLEVSNLGFDTNVSQSFGELSFNQLSQMAAENINKEIVTYDYEVISNIGASLKQIKEKLDGVKVNLLTTINRLNSGEGIWDGDAAEAAKNTLTNTADTNMTKIYSNLDICISNINAAAMAAQSADRGA